MDTFDFVIIGAGPAGEAAAYKARELGATVAVIDRLWFGGSCPHIGCLPSKSLLDGAARHAANPARYRWSDASAARDYMINRPPDAAEPDDSSHLRRLREAGAIAYRGTRDDRRAGPGHRQSRRSDARAGRRERGRCGRVGLEASADRGPRCDPGLDQPPGDPRPRAAGEPAHPRRWADGL